MSNGNGHRGVPADLDSEAAFLGALLIHPSAMVDAVALVRPEHFYKPAHQWVFASMIDNYNAGVQVSADTVRLGLGTMFDRLGGGPALMDLQAAAASPSTLPRLGAAITDLYTRRALIATAADVQAAAYDLAVPTTHAIDLLSPPADQAIRNRYTAVAVTPATLIALPPPRWLVDQIIPAAALAVIYGPPKSAKTFYALHLALCLATGTRFFGATVEPGPVVYVAAEGGQAALGQRIAAWCTRHNIDPDTLTGLVTFIPRPVPLADPAAVADLRAVIEDTAAVIVFIDTLARCMVGADENSSRDMTTAVAALEDLRATGATVTAVHHTGKNIDAGMRGHSSLLGAVDTAIELKGDRTAINITIAAQKDAPTPTEATWAKLEAGPRSAVIIGAAKPELDAEATREALAENISDAMHANPGITWTGRDVTDTIKARAEDVRAALKWLVLNGHVTEEPGPNRSKQHRLTRPYHRPEPTSTLNDEPF